MTTELDSSTRTELAASMIDVSKSYKHFTLRNIHFSVERGTVAGLIGPNGAGKSTTMRILVGLAVLPAIFLFLLSAFMLQMVTAVISESIGWTICVMVGCNVGMNVFLMQLFANAEVVEVAKSDVLSWPSLVLQIIGVELLIISLALAAAFLFQTRKRDLI